MARRYQHGTLTRRKRKTGPDVWQFRWMQAGKPKAKVIGDVKRLPYESDALRAIESLRAQINSRTLQERYHAVTVSGVVDRYLTEVAPHEVRKQTMASYKSYAKHIRTCWGASTLGSVDDPIAVENWLKTLPRGTAPHVRNFFHLLYQWAIRWKLVKRNPITLVRQSRKRAKSPRVLRPEEVKALLGALQEPYRLMVQVCCALGLRSCELVALKWGDFDWQNQTLLIQRSMVQGEINDTKTEASQKYLPVGAELMELLLNLKARTFYHTDADYVFAGDTGQPRWPGIMLTDHIKPAAMRAGIGKIGWHTLRHTYSTLLHELGAPLAVQKELLRHADIQTTINLYTQAVCKTKRQAAEKVQSILLGKKAG
jgi:integrase